MNHAINRGAVRTIKQRITIKYMIVINTLIQRKLIIKSIFSRELVIIYVPFLIYPANKMKYEQIDFPWYT